MKIIYILTLVVFCINVTVSQHQDLIQNAESRMHTSLNGLWQIIIDPYENGYYDYRYQPKTTNGYFENREQIDKTELIEYNFDNSQTLNVPGDWNSQSDELFFYEGTIWYKRDFKYQKPDGKRVFIYFGAANYEAHVYVNGKKVGNHEGGFTSFNFEISDQLVSGDNFVVIKVDNKRKRDAVPTLNTDWWNYGGLTRDVYLVEVSRTFIENYFIQLDGSRTDRVAGWIKLNGDETKQEIFIEIPELNFEKRIESNQLGYARFEFELRPALWSPDNPKLYDIIIRSKNDIVYDTIGFRTVETRKTAILLNGKPLYLKGICIHEEAPLRSGRAFSKDDALIYLNWIKQMNANFIRLAHYPHNEHMIRMAEKMGILIWEEIPVYWTILWDNKNTLKLAEQQLSEMIMRDWNRANVIIWSIGNETPLSEQRLKFMSHLAQSARKLDRTRLISAALERHYINETTQMIDDPLGEYLDVVGCNEYIGWYDGLPDKIDNIQWRSIYDKPHIISEFGAGALQGHHGDALTRWTEEYQEDVYKRQIRMLDKIPFISGMTPWILMDFRSPRRPLPGIQDYWNRKGVISERGIKKKAFYILQDYYKQK